MSGFSSQWLALREPADHAARDAGLVAALVAGLMAALQKEREITVVDLGCGTGSNLRGLSSHLGPRQSWRLVDHDPALLEAARDALYAWADRAEMDGDVLDLAKGDIRLRVTFAALDLATEFGAALDPVPDLVTAAALFDLVSQDWLDGFVAAVSRAGALFYTALSYDGIETWAPTHPADSAMQAAFLAHQGSDKGFGAAMGPGATAALAEGFGRRGYHVSTAPSPWRLGGEHGALIGMLKDGKAAAAAETGLVRADAVADWATARSRPETMAHIGHTDLLALPPR